MQKRHGLNDSDKVLVTLSLWVSAVSLFVTAMTLPMLPDNVAIFYKPDTDGAVLNSKYNNLLLILVSLIPASIMIVATILRSRNKLQNNFISIMLFSVMLSLCVDSIIIYGISEQFAASGGKQEANINQLIVIVALFIISLFTTLTPFLLHSPKYADKLVNGSGIWWDTMRAFERYWWLGAFGFLACAVVCVFVPDYFCYIPLAAAVLLYSVTIGILTKKNKSRAEQTIIDQQ